VRTFLSSSAERERERERESAREHWERRGERERRSGGGGGGGGALLRSFSRRRRWVQRGRCPQIPSFCFHDVQKGSLLRHPWLSARGNDLLLVSGEFSFFPLEIDSLSPYILCRESCKEHRINKRRTQSRRNIFFLKRKTMLGHLIFGFWHSLASRVLL